MFRRSVRLPASSISAPRLLANPEYIGKWPSPKRLASKAWVPVALSGIPLKANKPCWPPSPFRPTYVFFAQPLPSRRLFRDLVPRSPHARVSGRFCPVPEGLHVEVNPGGCARLSALVRWSSRSVVGVYPRTVRHDRIGVRRHFILAEKYSLHPAGFAIPWHQWRRICTQRPPRAVMIARAVI